VTAFFFSKLLPLLVYPLGLVWILLLVALGLQKKPAWQRAALWLAFALIWLGGNGWISAALTRTLEWQYLPPETLPSAPVIVVLSGVTQPAQYPRSTVEISGGGDRVIYAAHLYRQGVAPRLLVSGGNVPLVGTGSTDAEDMATLLEMLGVPREAIWLETRSRNTAENARYSWEFLSAKGIRRIVLVTSAQHMPRAVRLFERQGFEVIPAPTDYSVTRVSWDQLWAADWGAQFLRLFPTAGNLSRTTSALKEFFGMAVSDWLAFLK